MSLSAIENLNRIDQLIKEGKSISKADPFLAFNKGFLNLHFKAFQFINDLKEYKIGKVVFNRSKAVDDNGIINQYIVNNLLAKYDYNENEIIITYKGYLELQNK